MIVAQGLTKYYGLKPAIQDVSFEIRKGEILGFLGPNGAGKTTILRILTCYMPPTEGHIIVDNLNGRTQSLEVRKRIGFLPETVPLYTELSVSRFLAFSGRVKGLSGQSLRSEMDRVIHQCGLGDHRNRLITGGRERRGGVSSWCPQRAVSSGRLDANRGIPRTVRLTAEQPCRFPLEMARNAAIPR